MLADWINRDQPINIVATSNHSGGGIAPPTMPDNGYVLVSVSAYPSF